MLYYNLIMVKNILIKASGDITKNKVFLDFVKSKAKTDYVVLICGAGTKIGEELEKSGFNIKFNEHGRVTKTFKERRIARNVLENEQKQLQDKLVGVGVVVIVPIVYVGNVLCHINGDNHVKASYLGFDEIYIFTLKDRVEKKKEVFKDYEKVEIIGL